MKKVLSWVLVLALVLGSFSMAFAGTDNASDMKDAAQIKNVEAVDVMVATGIIGGYPDGNYYPEKTVTRAEMAKMICIAVNGGEDVGSYYASSCNFADSKDHWAAGYIAYCANEGIIDGRDADTFDPDTTVTGSEAAKMMLVALGYDSKIEKYVGTQWEANVLKAAKANDLFDGLEKFSAGLPLNRDNAAQIIFNGLKAVTVDYAQKDVISIGDVEITQSTKADPVAWKNPAAKANTMNPGDGYVELFESSFEGYLAYAPGAPDSFERPAHKWFYNEDKVASTHNDDKIGTYADDADYSIVVADNQTLAAELKDYDDDTFGILGADKDYTISATYLNGGNQSSTNGTFDVKKGDVIELYETDNDNEYKVVVVRYEAYTIGEVDTEVSDKDAKDGVVAYIDGIKDTDFPGFDAATYVDDAVIAVAYDEANSSNAIIDSYVPEKVTGEVTKFYDDSVFIDGTKYPVAGDYTSNSTNNKVENVYDFYLVNGYIFASVEVEDNSDTLYGLFLKDGSKEDAYGTSTKYAKVVTEEGQKVDYVVDADYVSSGYSDPGDNTVVAYTLNEDGEIDSLVATPAGITAKSTMSSKGIFAGKTVAEDVVIFYDDDDPSKEDWAVYGYKELAAAEDVAASFLLDKNGDIVAMYATANLFESKTTDIIAFYVSANKTGSTADGDIYKVTLLVDGKETVYETVAGVNAANIGTGETSLVEVALTDNGEIKKLTNVTPTNKPLPTDDFGDSLKVLRLDSAYATKSTSAYSIIAYAVYDKNGSNLVLGDASNNETINVSGAAVYQYVNGALEDGHKLSDVKIGDKVTVFQFSEASNGWDVIVLVK